MFSIKLCIKTMLSYCLKCRKNTKSKIPKAARTKNGRIMLYQNMQFVIVKIEIY